MDVTYSRTKAVKTDAAEKIGELFLEAASATIPAALLIENDIRILITIIHRDPPAPVNQVQMKLPVAIDTKALKVTVTVFPGLPPGIVTLMMHLQAKLQMLSAFLTGEITLLQESTTEILPHAGIQKRIVRILKKFHSLNVYRQYGAAPG